MMENGELDLMSGVSYTEERAEKMLFSELPMGEERYYLYADLNHTDISAADPKSLNGKRVGLLEGSVHETLFYEWEEKHDLQMQHVSITGLEDAFEKLTNQEIDCVVSTETPQLVEFGTSSIFQIGGSGIYFVINQSRPDIKEKLDNAMRKLQSDRPFYEDELYQRYLSSTAVATLSNEEETWLKEHGRIRAGWVNHDSGISYVNRPGGELTGVLNDYMKAAENSLGDQILTFEPVEYDSQEDMIKALKAGDIDMIFHFSENPYAAEANGFALSTTVLNVDMAAVTTEKYFNENEENTVALEKGQISLKWYVSHNYPNWKIVEYDSAKAVEKSRKKR